MQHLPLGDNQSGGTGGGRLSGRLLDQFSRGTEAAKVGPRGGDEDAKLEIGATASEMDRNPVKDMAALDEELHHLKVVDDPHQHLVYFKWEYGDEIIKVEFSPPNDAEDDDDAVAAADKKEPKYGMNFGGI